MNERWLKQWRQLVKSDSSKELRMGALVTITIVGLVAGTLITITAPPLAAVVLVLGVAIIAGVGYLAVKKAGG